MPSARIQTLGADTATSRGTIITSGAVDTKGSWVDIGGTLDFAAEELQVILSNDLTSAYLTDIGINVSGNRYVIAEDLASFKRASSGQTYNIPVHVPAGAQLSARTQASSSSDTQSVVIIASSSGMFGAPGASRMLRLSDITAGSNGIAVDPGATANTKTRVELTASTPFKANGILVYTGPNLDVARAGDPDWLTDIEMGAAGSEQVLVANQPTGTSATDDFPLPALGGWYYIEVPSGIRMSVNQQCSVVGAGDRETDMIIYGLVQ